MTDDADNEEVASKLPLPLFRLREVEDATFTVEGMAEGMSLYPFQRVGAGALALVPKMILADEMGLGKAQALDAPVLTPSGWVAIGDLEEGSIVIGADGKGTAVCGIFPQGEVDLYKVTFTDGSLVECCGDHLWQVQTMNHRYRGHSGVVKTTLELIPDLKWTGNGNWKWFIPMVAPVEFEPSVLPLDPYLLGCLLGDGGLKYGTTMLTSADEELVEYVKEVLPADVRVSSVNGSSIDYRLISDLPRNPLRAILKDLDLIGKGSEEKFIPAVYLRGSPIDRLSLLQGLLDTDGHVRDDNNVEYCTVSRRLAGNVCELVQSLGGTARIREKPTSHKLAYRMSVRLPRGMNPFRLKRKASAYTEWVKYPPSRAICSIEFSRRAQARCIRVEAADSLYVTSDYVVTHNTISVISAFKKLRDLGECSRLLVVCGKTLLYQWVEEAEKWYPGAFRCMIVEGDRAYRHRLYEELKKVEGHPFLDVDIILVTYSTLRVDEAALLQTSYQMVAFDEASNLRNPKADQTKAAAGIAHRALRRIAVTATPIQSRLEEYHSILGVIDPDLLGSRTRFENTFCNVEQFTIKAKKTGRKIQVRRIIGYKNLDRFKALIQNHVLQRTIDEVGAQMPELIIKDRWLDLTVEQKVRYEEIEDGLLDLEGQEDIVQQAIQQLTRLSQICDGTQLVYPEKSSCKLNELDDLLRNELRGESVVIFSKYVTMLEEVRKEVLNPLKIACGTIYGGQDAAWTGHQRKQFQDGKLKVMLMSTAGEMGMNLGAGKYLICCDLLYNEGRMRQLYGRIRRLSSVHPQAIIIRLLCRNTIEERVLQLLQKRAALIDFMDDPTVIDREHLHDVMKIVNRRVNLLD